MKLSARFVLLVSALVLAVAASAVAGLQALSRLDNELQAVVDNDMARLLAVTHVRRLFRSMVVLERDYILSKDAAERRGFDTQMTRLSVDLDRQLDAYSAKMPSEDARALTDIRGCKARWGDLDQKVRAAADDQATASNIARGHAQDPVSWEKAIGSLVTLNEHRLQGQVARAHVAYRSARSTLLLTSAAALAIALSLGLAVFRGIRGTLAELLTLNTDLEGLVESRTRDLAKRERSLRLVLDSTGDGLIRVARDGKLGGDVSAIAEQWFGNARAGQDISEYLFPQDAKQRMQFALGFSQLAEDILPWEVSAYQMPDRVSRGARTFALSFKPISEDGAGTGVLVVASDITERLRSEQTEQDARERQELVAHLLRDRPGFAEFVQSSEQLLAELQGSSDLVNVRRDLHTLKGNCGVFGLSSVASACEQLEQDIELEARVPSVERFDALVGLWKNRLKQIEEFFTEAGSPEVIRVEVGERDALVRSLGRRDDYEDIMALVERWNLTTTADRLGRLRRQTEYVAQRLGKRVQVLLEANDLRIPNDYLAGVWPTLVHALRNAVDHGVELEEARTAVGKGAAGTISLSTRLKDGDFELEIADDGNGVDREALVASATQKGFDAPPEMPLEELAFMQGVSSREQSSEFSGRGVGLAALREAVLAEHGRIELASVRGQGTRFILTFPAPTPGKARPTGDSSTRLARAPRSA